MASRPIGSLYAALGLDSSQFDDGIKRSQKKLQSFSDFKFGRGLKGGLDEVEGGMRGLASRAGIAGAALSSAGLAGVAAAAGFVTLTAAMAKAKEALAFADEIGDTANKLAVTTDALQEYRYAVHQLGGEYQDADAALEGFSKAFGAAHAQLTKRAAKPFEALGLDPKSFDSTEAALQAVIEKIANLKSTAEQAAIADKLGLTAMLPAIRAGGAAIDDLRKKAHELGYVMDADLIAKAGEANDKFEDLQQITAVQLHSAFVDMAPLILSVAGGIASMAREVNHLVSEIKDALPDLGKWVALIAQASGRTLGNLLPPGAELAAKGAGAALAKAAQDNRAKQLGVQVNNMLAGKPVDLRGTEWDPAKKAGAGGGASLLPPSGGGKGPRDRTADAIADTELKELNARMALTENVERLAEMKARQVDIETKKASQDVAQDVAEGTITAAAGKIIVAKNNELADLEKQKIQREATAELAAQELEQRHAVASEYEKVAGLAAEEAATAAERNRIEAKALEDRQRLERRDLENEIEQKLIREKITESGAAELRAAQADRQAAEKRAQARKAQVRIIDEETDLATSALRKQMDQLDALAMVSRSTYARAKIEAKILKLRQQEERRLAQAALDKAAPGSVEEQIARDRIEGLEDIHKAEEELAKRATGLDQAMLETADAISEAGDAFRRHDWGGALQSLSRAIETVAATLGKSGGRLGKFGEWLGRIGAYAQVGSVFADMVGGRQNTGSQVGAVIGSAIGNAVAGPLGAIVGSFLGNLAGGAIGGKPSNHASVAQIKGGSVVLVSTGKETEETKQAAAGAANAIIAGEKLLRDAGIALSQTVHAVDLGQRDKTRIVLSDGTEFRTNSVGDPTEAADAALRRLLEGATYADEALKQLVESAIAAGKGFDDIATILQAQQVGKQLADQILQLSDPQAYAKKQVTDDIKAQRDAAKALFDQGALTADQLAAINVQLTTLEGLKLADVMKEFGGSVGDATEKLRDWLDSLTGQLSGRQSKAQAFAALQAAGLAARNHDSEALGKIPELGNAFIDAAKASASSAFEVQQAIALARAIGSSALLAATNPAGLAPSAGMSAANSPAVGDTSSHLVASDTSASEATAAGDSDLAVLKSEIASLREDVRTAAATLAVTAKASAKLLDRWDGEGLPPARSA